MVPQAALGVLSGEVMRVGDEMEVVTATATTKVKKINDYGTEKERQYVNGAHRELGDREKE